MKAMILAAGVGSRLRPLTDRTPKALVNVGAAPMLELVARKLIDAGVTEIIVNAFHLAEQVVDFVKKRGPALGARFELSVETALLDTGGGLKNAAWFFDDGKPFFVHNVDVLSEISLNDLQIAHLSYKSTLATLAVQARKTKRALSFDSHGRLVGREIEDLAHGIEALGFSGVQMVSPDIFKKMPENGVFSLTDAYVRLAQAGEHIRGFRCDHSYWTDIGDAKKLAAARKHAKAKAAS